MTKKALSGMLSKFKGEEGDLIPILQSVQEKDGYISEDAVEHVARSSL